MSKLICCGENKVTQHVKSAVYSNCLAMQSAADASKISPEGATAHANAMGAPGAPKVKIPESAGSMTKYKLVFLGDMYAAVVVCSLVQPTWLGSSAKYY